MNRPFSASVGGVIALVVKLSTKFAKSFKILQVAATTGSFALLTTWQFAGVIVTALVLHEYGHILAMKHFGMKVKGFYLIPFVGGVAVSETQTKKMYERVMVSLAGPASGVLIILVLSAVYSMTHDPFVAAIAGWVALFNVIQLLPFLPLDGGQAILPLGWTYYSERAKMCTIIAGCVTALVSIFVLKNTLLLFAAIFGGLELYEAQRDASRYHSDTPVVPTPLTKREAKYTIAMYGALVIGLLCFMQYFAHEPMASVAMDILRG